MLRWKPGFREFLVLAERPVPVKYRVTGVVGPGTTQLPPARVVLVELTSHRHPADHPHRAPAARGVPVGSTDYCCKWHLPTGIRG